MKTKPWRLSSRASATDSGLVARRSARVRGGVCAAGAWDHTRVSSPSGPRDCRRGDDGSRVADGRVNFGCVAHDARIGEQPRAIRCPKRRDPLRVKAGKRDPEGRALAQDGQPGQARLEGLQGEPLEERALAADRHTPLGVVIRQIVRA
jgi:hypothetical protein